MISLRTVVGVAVAAIFAFIPGAPAFAQSSGDFFKGKQITMIIGAAAGGGYDLQGRLVAHYIGRHLPGNPNVIVQNLPAAAGIEAADYIYTLAPKDGTTFGLMQREMLAAKLNSPQSIRFDIAKLNWIGNIDSETGLVVAWHSSPVTTTGDLFTHAMIIGGTGPLIDTETLPRLLNTLIGTKFNVVSGYSGLNEVVLAMERGEVMGIGDWSWSNIKSGYADMLGDKKIRPLMQAALKRIDDLPDVPSMLEYAKNAGDRQLMEVFLSQEAVARPIAAPPGVPPERVKILRDAFIATTKDPDFLKDARQAKLDLSPTSGEDVEGVVALIAKTPKSVADRMTAAIAPPK